MVTYHKITSIIEHKIPELYIQTKLSKYCDGVMEAAWLAAVIVVPVFFNVYSSRIFEPDKITLLRSLSIIILAVWIIKLIEVEKLPDENQNDFWIRIDQIIRIPLLLPLIFLVIVYFNFDIFFNFTPGKSIWILSTTARNIYTIILFDHIHSNNI